MSTRVKYCKRCRNNYTDYPSLSRRDNETEICSKCGNEEAMNDFMKINTIPIENLVAECIFCNKLKPSIFEEWIKFKIDQLSDSEDKDIGTRRAS